jgi:hypothetical protein
MGIYIDQLITPLCRARVKASKHMCYIPVDDNISLFGALAQVV